MRKWIGKTSNDIDKRNKWSIKFNKKIFFLLIVILLVAGGIGLAKSGVFNQGLDKDKYTILEAGVNISKINVKGEVKSEKATGVYASTYSDANPIIKEVKVEIGDKVKVGDTLATLDTNKLESDIKVLETTIATTDAANASELKSAKATYDNALALSSDKNNENIKNAATAVNAAKLDYDNKKDLYEKNKILHDSGAITDQEFKQYEISYENAKDTYDKVTVSLNNVKAKVKLDLTVAKNNYDQAKAKVSDNSKKITLENYKKDLQNATITSPVDGVISLKNASVGNPVSGELFEIKDENNVTITVDVKDVDIEKIKEGQRAQIKADSSYDKSIAGEVVSINSIAKAENNSSLNLNNDSNDKEATFEVKIRAKDTDSKLKIGMKAQADIIVDEKDNVYTVPTESMIKNKDNNYCIYIAEKQGKDYVVKELQITRGTETDSKTEIYGDNIKDGVIMLNSPGDYELGSVIKINEK
ncbi:HlyD family secretion protein [Clostridium saccharoperbutylacetonicum]|uniref:HlyD family secretion protein n=1 Tax=Clostridium saccharoperbutylacetonicum TaxID=36745 RepID=UPI000983AAC9|nr:HlyD family efflux transporter periplasmic adaptor subunit [Clostridium saccharoperbutylacetonicum]AQR96886.1 putative efflux pump membrane fusion protein [Clostridium saccharoperbutylacetonicum]NSB32764.1 multidrug resistance efflux pump [Clostridium saccharoperbutylacetonicum]